MLSQSLLGTKTNTITHNTIKCRRFHSLSKTPSSTPKTCCRLHIPRPIIIASSSASSASFSWTSTTNVDDPQNINKNHNSNGAAVHHTNTNNNAPSLSPYTPPASLPSTPSAATLDNVLPYLARLAMSEGHLHWRVAASLLALIAYVVSLFIRPLTRSTLSVYLIFYVYFIHPFPTYLHFLAKKTDKKSLFIQQGKYNHSSDQRQPVSLHQFISNMPLMHYLSPLRPPPPLPTPQPSPQQPSLWPSAGRAEPCPPWPKSCNTRCSPRCLKLQGDVCLSTRSPTSWVSTCISTSIGTPARCPGC